MPSTDRLRPCRCSGCSTAWRCGADRHTVEGTATVRVASLGDLLLAVVIGVLTAVAARNLPGVLEIRPIGR